MARAPSCLDKLLPRQFDVSSHHLHMSNKRKRSRIVSYAPDTPDHAQSASSSANGPTTTFTDDNARRLQTAHTVILQNSTQAHTRRQSQLSAHTKVWNSEPSIPMPTLLDGEHVADVIGEGRMDVDEEDGEDDGEGELAEGPKRLPVCVIFKLNMYISNYRIHRAVHVKNGSRTERSILTSFFVTMLWVCILSRWPAPVATYGMELLSVSIVTLGLSSAPTAQLTTMHNMYYIDYRYVLVL